MRDVVVQVVRNEGGLSLRVSSAADILEQDGSWRRRSAGADAVRGDEPAYGSLGGKLLGCGRQRAADANALLLARIVAPVDPPPLRRRRAASLATPPCAGAHPDGV